MQKRLLYLYLYLPVLALALQQCAASRKLKYSAQNEETIRVWFEEGWNKHQNLALIERCFSPDWTDGNPIRSNQAEGYEGIRQMVGFYEKAFAETHFVLTHIFADETHAAVRYEVRGRHVSDAFGIPTTGKIFVSSGIVLYEMDKGKIKRSWQELDLMGIIKQLKSTTD